MPQQLAFSNGWLDRFKEHLGLREVWYYGEAASAPIDQVPPEQGRLQVTLGPYPPCDSYNFDETALYFHQTPSHALGNGQTSGSEEDKTCISIGFCANADGSDMGQPLFKGHLEKPHAFTGRSAAALGFDYEFNANAWMTGNIWQR